MATNVFDLFARISLDSSGYEKGLAGAGSAFSKAADGIKSTISTISTVSAAAVSAVAAGIGTIAEKSLNSYTSYEQLVGGVETLFKDSADKVQQYADNAYKTAGMSANQYMEQLTSFASSLIQSTGRGAQQDIDKLKEAQDAELTERKRYWEDVIDLAENNDEKKILKRQREDDLADLKQYHDKQIEEAERANNKSVTTAESLNKAADIGNMIMIDMSDNVNKMGSAMESIQNAYQGFAKQNYTMLDNLKIGYGGTKTEAERLVNTAAEMTDVQAELGITIQKNNLDFANLAQAIHVVQYQMGITGTTSKEAASTIEGSAKSMKAAWDNLLVELGKDNGNTGSLIDALVGSIETNLDNIIPRLEKILGGIGDAVVQLSPVISKKLPELLNKVFPTLFKNSVTLTKTLFTSLANTLPAMTDTFGQLVVQLLEGINNSFESEQTDDNNIIVRIIRVARRYIPLIKDLGSEIIQKTIEGLNEKLSKINFTDIGQKIQNGITGAIDFIDGLLESIDFDVLGNKIADAMNSVDWSEVTKKIFELIGEVISSGGDVLKGFAENIEWDNLIDLICLTFAPKLLPALIGAIGAEFGSTAVGTALVGLGEYVVPALAAAMGGWMLGTAIRGWIENEFGEGTIDSVIEPVFKAIDKAFGTHFAKSDEEFMAEQEIDDKTYYEKALINEPSAHRVRKFMEASDFTIGDMRRYIQDREDYGTDEEIINKMIKALEDYAQSDKTIKFDLNNGTIVVQNPEDFAGTMSGAINRNLEKFNTISKRMSGGRGY